jgi:hypothetical protein
LTGAKPFKLEDVVRFPIDGVEVTQGKRFVMEDLFDESYISNNKLMIQLTQKLISENFIDTHLIVALFASDKMDGVKDVYKKYNQYVNQYGVNINSKQVEFALLCKTELK